VGLQAGRAPRAGQPPTDMLVGTELMFGKYLMIYVIVIGACGACVGGVWLLSGPLGFEAINPFAARNVARNVPKRTPCHDDWQKCGSNYEVVNEYDGVAYARSACAVGLAGIVKYGEPRWSSPFKFASYIIGVDTPMTGVLMLIEPDVQLQNGFGAMVHSKASCRYDLRGRKVLEVTAAAR
jgi:hypothetical protein